MDRLLDILRQKAAILTDSELPDLEEARFLEAFLNVYNIHNIDGYCEVVGFTAYLGALLLTYGIKMDFLEVYEHMQSIQPILDNYDFDFENFENYLNALKELNDLNLLPAVSPNSATISKSVRLNFRRHNLIKYDRILCTDAENNYDERASVAMIKLFKALPDPEKFMAYTDVLDIKFCIAETIDSYDQDFSIFKGTRVMNRMIDKERGKVVKATIREYVQRTGLKVYQYYDDIQQHYTTLRKRIQNLTKDINKSIAKMESLDSKVCSMPKNEKIKLGGDIEKMLIDAEVEYAFLLFALKHNLDIFMPVEEQNKEYNNNSITKMEILFSKYGYSFSVFLEGMQNEIVTRGYENVESILKQIKYSNLGFVVEDVGLFFNVIINSNPSIIKFLDSCFKNKVITKEFTLRNSRLLYDLELFNRFFNNFNYLLGFGMKLDIKGMENVLLLDSQFLIQQLNILGEYQFELVGNNFSNIDIIKNPKLLDILDNLIELGYGKTILASPRYLTPNGLDMVKRIIIAQLIGLSPTNNQNKFLGAITTGNNFYVGPKDYDKFIIDYKISYQNPKVLAILDNTPRQTISETVKKLPIIKELDARFMLDFSCYEISGVRISRLRVMRNLEMLIGNPQISEVSLYDLVFQAVLYNMIPNVEPDKLTQIYNAICSIDIDFAKTYTLN